MFLLASFAVCEKGGLVFIHTGIFKKLKLSSGSSQLTHFYALVGQREHFRANSKFLIRILAEKLVGRNRVVLTLVKARHSLFTGHHLCHRLTDFSPILNNWLPEEILRRVSWIEANPSIPRCIIQRLVVRRLRLHITTSTKRTKPQNRALGAWSARIVDVWKLVRARLFFTHFIVAILIVLGDYLIWFEPLPGTFVALSFLDLLFFLDAHPFCVGFQRLRGFIESVDCLRVTEQHDWNDRLQMVHIIWIKLLDIYLLALFAYVDALRHSFLRSVW